LNELSWNENHFGPGEIVTIDLASYTGQADVQARFRYYGNGWDYWAEVDDISLTCFATEAILKDGFETPGMR
jgi:hypothetical protein